MITRFAPSPTGFLHLGHAYAARVAWDAAQEGAGVFQVRMEDIDTGRCRAEFEAGIFEDLEWLGFSWPTPVMRQSERMEVYAAALRKLEERGMLYPCFCTRQEIAQAVSAPQGAEGPVYPGTCRSRSREERADLIADGRPWAHRLDTVAALALTGPLTWRDAARGVQTAQPELLGDVVLARKEVATSYHLAVTVDDAAQGVSLVTRGEDLFSSTHIHRLLQALLDLPVPEWRHHRLVCDESGRRLAKRDAARSIRSLREAGVTPAEIWQRCGVGGSYGEGDG